MTSEKGDDSSAVQAAPQSMCTGSSGMMMMFMMMLLLMFMFSPIGKTTVEIANVVIYPIIGFNGMYPVWTILIAGLFMIVFSTITRHFFTDWVESARSQKKLAAYNKELQKAQKDGNESRVKKLQEMNPDIMKMQSDQMMNQMKPTMFTMFFALIVFRWLYTYMVTVNFDYITMPFSLDGDGLYQYPLNKMFLENFICCGGGFFGLFGKSGGGGIPFWVGLYSLASVPIGQILMRGLKVWEFKRRLRKLEAETLSSAEEKIDEAFKAIGEAKHKGADVQKASSLMGKARVALTEEDPEVAIKRTENALELLEHELELHTRAAERMDTLKVSIAAAKAKKMDVKSFNRELKAAKDALRSHDHDRVFAICRNTQERLKKEKKTFNNLSREIQNTKSFLFDLSESDDGRLASMLRDAERAYKRSEYRETQEALRNIRLEASRLQERRQKALKMIKKAEQLLASRGGSSDPSGASPHIKRAKEALREKAFDRALDEAEAAREELL